MKIIKELTNKEELSEAFPVMKQLRTDLTDETYFELLSQMKKEGYQLFALYDEEKIVSLAGLSWRTSFYNKKHIYIHDLITDASSRSRGYGES
ncbi:MAG: GNAT family N-acetyltransferase, partial [Mesobacillus sp.]|uniref:GNAT family N-acetyltransferase n=1 Tax=Mesobacillus sp. TaxID=2675271 RepID=UPI003C644394